MKKYNDKYDFIDNDYFNEAAIVIKDNLYGVILLGGFELVAPSYDYISSYKDGYAQAIRKGVCVFLDLLGRECMKRDGKLVVISSTNNPREILPENINGVTAQNVESILGQEVVNNRQTVNTNIKTVKILKNGYKVVEKEDSNSRYCYIAIVDEENNIVLPFKYNMIDELENNIYRVCTRASYYSSYGYGYYGLLDQNFNEIVTPKYSYIIQMQGLFVAKTRCEESNNSSEKVGLIDCNDNIVIPFEYSSIIEAEKGYVWIHDDSKIGLATIYGNVIFKPSYGKVGSIKNGLVPVNNGYYYYEEDEDHYMPRKRFSDGLWGVVDLSGRIVLQTLYDSVDIGDDFINVTKTIADKDSYFYEPYFNSKKVYGRFNQYGELIIKDENGNFMPASKKYDWQEDYTIDGKSTVYYKGKVGIVNNNNQLLIPLKNGDFRTYFILPEEYDWGYESIADYIIVEKEGKQGLADINSNIIIQPIYSEIIPIYDGIHIVFRCNAQDCHNAIIPSNTWLLFNVKGESILNNLCEEIRYIGFSLLAIKFKNKYSIIDFTGQPTSNLLFDMVHNFGDTSSQNKRDFLDPFGPLKVEGIDYAIVGINNKYGIIDNQANLIIQPIFSSLLINNNNQILADGILINAFEYENINWVNSVIKVTKDYDSAELLENGIIIVSKDKLFGCINLVGCVVIPLKYSSLTFNNKLLNAEYYDEDEGTLKRGVINFLDGQIVPLGQYDKIIIKSEIILYKQDGRWGASSPQGHIICCPLYDHIAYLANNLLKVGMNSTEYTSCPCYRWGEDGELIDETTYGESTIINWGLIDNKGNELLPLKYSAISDKVICGLVEICANNKVGYVDITGHLILEPTYKSIGEFVDGFSVVSKVSYYSDIDGRCREGSRYGVINSYFEEIIPCVFDSINYDRELRRFRTDVGYKTIDGNFIAEIEGKEIFIDKKYKYCKPFNDICAITILASEEHDKYGLIDKELNEIMPPIFSRLDYVEDGLYKFMMNDLYGLVDSMGNIISQNIYNGIGKFEDNLACVLVKPSLNIKLYGLIDSMGNEILEPSYEFIGKFSNKFAVVMRGNIWWLFSIETHQLRLIPNVSYLGPCKDNLCSINIGGLYDNFYKKTKGGLWGYVSVDGQIAIEPIFKRACGFSEGIAAVMIDGKWGFINTEGDMVVSCDYDGVEFSYKNGKGALIKSDRVYVFDKFGKTIETYDNRISTLFMSQ